MSNVRSTIELLLRVLRENGTLKLKAEVFRLAKFNEDEAVEPLWHLLFELLYYCKYGSIEDVSVRAWMEMKNEEIVVYVKHEMQHRGFFSADLAALPKDMTAGSRELLLALGWLLCKENVIQRFMMNCTSPLQDDTAAYHRGGSGDLRPSLASPPPLLQGEMVARVKQLLWFNNKLQMNLRTLLAVQKEKNKLKHRMHEATYGAGGSGERGHLSMFEVHLLRHPDLLKKNVDLLERDNERLQHLIRWTECEDVFWKWMESVLDEKQKEKQEQHQSSTSPRVAVTSDDVMSVPRHSASRLRQCHDDLQDAIIKYETIVENLERLWESKAMDVSEEELDSVLSAIDLELSIQKANIQLSQSEQSLSAQSEPTFVYEPKAQPVSKASSVSTGYSSDNSQNPQHVLTDIQDEIRMLESKVDDLQLQLDSKQDNFKHELQALSARFTDAVCIPPPSRTTVNV